MFDRLPPGLLDGPIWTSGRRSATRLEWVVPTAGGQIVFDVDSGRGVLVGLRTVSAVVEPPGRARGVRLTGAGVYAIVGPDVGQLVDDAVDLDTLAPAGELSRVRDSGVHHDDLVELVVALCSRFEVDPRVLRAEAALRRGETCRDAAVAAAMDRRRLVPLFRRQVGVNPKTYQRLVRFAGVMTSLRDASDRPIATIAAEHSFADKAHLTRDVRQFAAITPSMLTRLPPGPVSHLPIDGTTH